MKMADAALRGFREEPGSPAAINGALLVIALALLVKADGPGLDTERSVFEPWIDSRSGFRPWAPPPA